MKIKHIIISLNMIFFLSCSNSGVVKNSFPSKFDKEIFSENMMIVAQLPDYVSNPIILYNDKSINILFEDDTIQLDKSLESYSCLFTSGLINPRMLGPNPNCHIHIYDIIELSNPEKNLKIHKYKFRGLCRLAEDGQLTYYLNGTQWFIEISNDFPFKSEELIDLIHDSELTCIISRPMM